MLDIETQKGAFTPIGAASFPTVEKTIQLRRYAIDAGNRQVKYGRSSYVSVMASVVKELHPLDNPVFSEGTAIVHYLQGDNLSLKNKRWAVGELAAEQQGDATFKSEKALMQPYLVFAAIAPGVEISDEPITISISELRLCLPDAHNQGKVSAIRSAIKGFHQIERNGQILNVRIGNVTVEPECAPAYRWCKSQGLFLYDQKNAILDLGGGNGSAQPFATNGSWTWEERVSLPGVFRLAEALASDPLLLDIEEKGCSPKPELIMDGIANQTYLYGTTGRSFADIFPHHRDRWLNRIRSDIKTKWHGILSQLGEVIIVGGSAPLAQPFCESSGGRFKIAPEPEKATARGMLL